MPKKSFILDIKETDPLTEIKADTHRLCFTLINNKLKKDIYTMQPVPTIFHKARRY